MKIHQTDATGCPISWTSDTTTEQAPEYLQDLRPELIQYIQQADRHTLKLIQKFITSLER